MFEQITQYDLKLAIFLFVLGISVDLVTRLIHSWYMSPKLDIDSDVPLYEEVRRDVIFNDNDKEKRFQRYHSIKIKNNGRTSAENCIGSIFLNVTDEKEIISEPIYYKSIINKLTSRGVSGAVCWARQGNPQSVTINSKDEELLDVYKIIFTNKLEKLIIPSEKGWDIFRVVLKPKVYDGKLKITAANAEPVEKAFKLKIEETDVKIIFE